MIVALLLACAALAPTQTPRATLHLALRERESGEARAGKVRLWRVGLLPEPGWTAGDVFVGIYEVGADGLNVENLEPGRYRAQCDAHAGSVAPLGAFMVNAPRAQVALDVVAPRIAAVWVDLVDVTGKPFDSAQFQLGRRAGDMLEPTWLHPRSRIEEDGSRVRADGTGGGMIASTSIDQPWKRLRRGEHGFALDAETEDSEMYATLRSFDLRVPEHGTFHGDVKCDTSHERRFQALLVEKGRYEGLFTLPDGSELDLGRLQVETPLLPVGPLRAPDWWLDVPIHVVVYVPGCRPLDIVHHMREGMPEKRRLERSR